MGAERRTRLGKLHLCEVLFSLTVLLAGLTGCRDGTNVVPLSGAEKNLKNIVLAYHDAHSGLGHAPKDADELKPFLKPFGDPDALLNSPNDGEPFVVVWGTDPTRGGPTGYQGMWQIIAYEKKGSGGKRAVVDVRGRPLTVPEDDFRALKFAGGHNPSAD
jgi:hypothetical protein